MRVALFIPRGLSWVDNLTGDFLLERLKDLPPGIGGLKVRLMLGEAILLFLYERFIFLIERRIRHGHREILNLCFKFFDRLRQGLELLGFLEAHLAP